MHEEREVKIKVSVIIPCYNSERFLHECLDSILNQTLKEIEVICIDDGSTDGTCKILQEYAQKDERFMFLKQENLFAGTARNKGMGIAKGKYLYILDSDDFFEPMMLEKVYRKSEEDSADICLFGGGDYDMRTGLFSYRYGLRYKYLPKKIPFSSDDVLKDIYQVHHIASCSKLYNRLFVENHNLKFQVLATANDVFFNNSAIVVAERITIVDDWLWTYRKGTSTSLVETLDQSPFCIDEAHRAVKEFLNEKQLYSQVSKSFKELVLGSGVYSLVMMKTKAAWLRCALFLKEEYIPEFGLLECFDFLKPNSYLFEWLQFLTESTNENLHVYMPKLRADETAVKKTPEWEFALNENHAKVSVIIPVYNSEDYLEECIRSVLNQTLTDIEIICVNDGSTDSSLEILNHFAQEERRIQIISQENKGTSFARNVGLDSATGEYVMFIDSDDLLLRVSLEHLYRKAKYNDLDQMFCEGAVTYESRNLYSDKEKMLNYYRYKGEYPLIYQGGELLIQLVKEKDLKVSPCMQIFRLNFLKDNDIYFDSKVYEDTIFTLLALINAERVMVHEEQLYIKKFRKFNLK